MTAQMGFEEMVLAVAGAALEEAGIAVEPFRTETGFGLLDAEAGAQLSLDNVTAAARAAGPQWRETVQAWVGQFLIARAELQREPNDDELLARLRTRLLRPAEDQSYAREFADGLVVALATDGAATVQNHTDQSVMSLADRVSMSIDDLFAIGQANTDAEPVDEVSEIEGDVRLLTGESFFIAAKVANFPALLDLIGPAPHGVAFAPLNRHLVLYTVLPGTVSSVGQVMALANCVAGVLEDDEFDHPGGLLTDTTYYWAPDGRVEYLARLSMLIDDKPTITVLPGPAFGEYVRQGSPD